MNQNLVSACFGRNWARQLKINGFHHFSILKEAYLVAKKLEKSYGGKYTNFGVKDRQTDGD